MKTHTDPQLDRKVPGPGQALTTCLRAQSNEIVFLTMSHEWPLWLAVLSGNDAVA